MDISKHIVDVKSIPEHLSGKQLGAQLGIGIGTGMLGCGIGNKLKTITGVPGGGKAGLVLGVLVGLLGGVATSYSDDMLKSWLYKPEEVAEDE